MGHLRIHCNGCGNSYVVYHRDDWKDWRARTCPTCQAEIPEEHWDGILRGFNEMEDANIELAKDKVPFTVGYVVDAPKHQRCQVYDDFMAFIYD